VVEELLRMVPRDRLFRLDSDVATSGVRVIEILGRFSASTPGVLVGTQMVAKGHDYPMVTLVLVADADTGLYAPDFRASERTFQLLTQVAGRAGRADRPGRVLVQSWNPDVDCVRMAVTRDIVGFYREELAVREHLGYPPFRDLIKLVLSGAVDERVDAGGRHLIEKLRTALPDVRGPARLPRIRGLSRRQIVVADTDGDRARRVVGRALQRFRGPYARRGLDIVVDVDPQWFA
jgi:primosomal protein N' (replication factor Y)